MMSALLLSCFGFGLGCDPQQARIDFLGDDFLIVRVYAGIGFVFVKLSADLQWQKPKQGTSNFNQVTWFQNLFVDRFPIDQDSVG